MLNRIDRIRETFNFNVPANHKFKGFILDEEGHFSRKNYILVNENGNIKAINKKRLNEDFFNPSKYFEIFAEYVDNSHTMDEWNNANQEEREKMIEPAIRKFWVKYKEEMSATDLEKLMDDAEDSNYHTPLLVLQRVMGER